MCANCEVCLIFTAMVSSYGSLHTDLFQPDSVHNIVLRACNTLQIPILWLVIEKKHSSSGEINVSDFGLHFERNENTC